MLMNVKVKVKKYSHVVWVIVLDSGLNGKNGVNAVKSCQNKPDDVYV